METVNYICPFSRPWNVQRVLENFSRQNYPAKRLIVVENGKALNSFPRIAGVVVLQSENHQSWAKNRGLDWLSERGGGIWSTLDDDDYYGPSYAGEVAFGATHGRQLWGKASWWINPVRREKLWLMPGPSGEEIENAPCIYIHGATISGWVQTTPRFRDTGRHGEDCDLLKRVDSLWATSRNNYCWIRNDDPKVSHTFGESDHYLKNMSLAGLMEHKLDWRIVDGLTPGPGRRLRNSFNRGIVP